MAAAAVNGNRAADREMRKAENRGSLLALCVGSGWMVKQWSRSGHIYTTTGGGQGPNIPLHESKLAKLGACSFLVPFAAAS
ncbi:hypothetical protein D5086_018937 [Populus alba]|uniref:Uncharacterized protein n=1 Tax=Populus alba TaxID=43335 RepID=A0ACC4BRP5_POPAL